MQLENVHNDGEFRRIIIKNVTILLLEVHCEVDTPWGGSYGMTTLELGIGW
jgi:hypothetical protein